TGSQKPHFVRDGIALSLGVPAEKVRSIWVVGPGSYGRGDADAAAMDAAELGNGGGKPGRVQYTREQAPGRGARGRASLHRARADMEAPGTPGAPVYRSKRSPRIGVNPSGGASKAGLAGGLAGTDLKPADGCGVPAESYEFANKRMAWETIAPLLERSSPL